MASMEISLTGNQSSIRRREFVCVDAIQTSDSGWGGAVSSLEGSWGCSDTNGDSAKGRKGEVPAEIRHAYINDKASMTFRGLLRF